MDDIQIIRLYHNRDQAAISESNTKYGLMLLSISQGVLENSEDSEECVNDTYLNAWNNIPPQEPQSLAAFLGRIVRNISINRWHKNRTKKRGGGNNLLLSELGECVPSSGTVENQIETAGLAKTIDEWLSSLAQRDRVLFIRRYWFGESLTSLAEEAEVSPNILAGRIFRLRKKLKLTLEREGILL